MNQRLLESKNKPLITTPDKQCDHVMIIIMIVICIITNFKRKPRSNIRINIQEWVDTSLIL